MAKGTRAGAAMIRVYADAPGFQRSLKRIEGRLRAFGGTVQRIGRGVTVFGAALTGMATAVLAPLGMAARSFARFGDSIDKMSARTGIGAQALSELGFAAEQSGASLGGVERGIRGMQRQLFNAALGSKEATDALDALGMQYADLEGRAPEDQFTAIMDALAGVDDHSRRAGIAMKLFGRSGSELLPLVGQMAALRQEARDLGITLTDADATAAADLTDAMNRLRRSAKAVWMQVGAALAPALTDLSTRAAWIVARVTAWVKENGALIVTIAKVAVGVAAAGVVVTALGTGLVAFGFAAMGAASAVGVLSGVLAALVSPLGLIIASVGLAGAAFLHFSGVGTAVVAWLGGRFKALADYFGEAVGLMGRALATGDFASAGKLAWATLKLAFAEGVLWIHNLLDTGLDGTLDKWLINVKAAFNAAFKVAIGLVAATKEFQNILRQLGRAGMKQGEWVVERVNLLNEKRMALLRAEALERVAAGEGIPRDTEYLRKHGYAMDPARLGPGETMESMAARAAEVERANVAALDREAEALWRDMTRGPQSMDAVVQSVADAMSRAMDGMADITDDFAAEVAGSGDAGKKAASERAAAAKEERDAAKKNLEKVQRESLKDIELSEEEYDRKRRDRPPLPDMETAQAEVRGTFGTSALFGMGLASKGVEGRLDEMIRIMGNVETNTETEATFG